MLRSGAPGRSEQPLLARLAALCRFQGLDQLPEIGAEPILEVLSWKLFPRDALSKLGDPALEEFRSLTVDEVAEMFRLHSSSGAASLAIAGVADSVARACSSAGSSSSSPNGFMSTPQTPSRLRNRGVSGFADITTTATEGLRGLRASSLRKVAPSMCGISMSRRTMHGPGSRASAASAS